MQPRTRPEQPRHGIRDLHDPSSSLHTSPIPDTTYVLAIKSLALLHRASQYVMSFAQNCGVALTSGSLFDRPEVCHPSPQPPSHIPSLHAVQQVETALRLFRKRLPLPFSDNHHPRSPDESYDGPSDPWWITMHANLYTAEMMMFKELAHHQPQAYETAVSCARALVGFVKRLRPDGWVHVGESRRLLRFICYSCRELS